MPIWLAKLIATLTNNEMMKFAANLTFLFNEVDFPDRFKAAAAAGYRTLLLEQYAQPAQGTSSKSSKLIHGGLRYLKQMQLRMTRLACRERDRMLQLDPHLVQPIEPGTPVATPLDGSRPATRGTGPSCGHRPL